MSSFGAPETAYGPSGAPSVTISASTNQLVVQAFNATNTSNVVSASEYSGTSRYNQSLTGGSAGHMALLFGDTPGNALVTISETVSDLSSYWGSVAVPLIGR